MRAPLFDHDLDLVIVAPDGSLAAGCVCWMDTANHIGLFEPLGTRPEHRRRGLATALALEGMRRLRTRGATRVQVEAIDPGRGRDGIPPEFTAARAVYTRVGFRPLRRVFCFYKPFQVAPSRAVE
jgi:GNAT superfamily N-acetyltransferase